MKKYINLKLIFIIVCILLVLIGLAVIIKKDNKKLNIEKNELYQYGEELEKMNIAPNTIVAKIYGQDVLFREVETYRKSINYSIENGSEEDEGKSAFYEVLKNKVYVYLAKEYPDAVTYNLNVEMNIEKTKNEWENGYGEYSVEEYRKKYLEILCIEQDEIWLDDDKFLQYLQYISQEHMLVAKGSRILHKFMLERTDLVNDKELNKKVEELNQIKEKQTEESNNGNMENVTNLMTEYMDLYQEISELYMWDLILNSKLELCVDRQKLSNTVPEIYTEEPVINSQEEKDVDKIEATDESETNNSINEHAEDVTEKIENGKFYGSGIISKIDDDHIYFGNSDSKQYYINRSSFPYVNGRTSKSMNMTDVKVGDYLNEIDKKIVIYRNIFGEELNQELLYNFTLSSDERIMMVNSIEIEEINITNDTAFVKIKYGDIIGDQITDETFETIVEMNSDTKFYSKGNNINSINDLEIAKYNINSIVLNRNTINKKNPAIVNTFESTDN